MRGYCIELVKGVDKQTNTPRWAYVLVPERKQKIYAQKVKVLGGKLEQEGAVVLYQGEGDTIPEDIHQKIEAIKGYGSD